MAYSLHVRPVNHVSKDYLESVFSRFGEVVDVYIPREYKTQKRKSFGYVKYDNKHAASRAIEALNGTDLNGHTITVQWSSDTSKTPEEMVAAKEKRQLERNDKPRFTDEEHERFVQQRKRPEGPFHERYFTAVDYPSGVGEEFTPMYQKNLPPVGERRTFFSWCYVPSEQIERILQSYLSREARENADKAILDEESRIV